MPVNVTEPATQRAATSLAMRLLQAGVPLSLLLDLTEREGPDSAKIAARERPVASYAFA
jgi:hypothetical protein